ncbi:MAG: Tfp pilus assembly protein FimT/FimU [Lachnospiraceae bacterium]
MRGSNAMMNENKFSLKSNNNGFTLMELLVVIGIIAILMTLTASAATYLVRGDIKKATKTLYSTVASSRTQAMAKQGSWAFTVDDSSGVFVLKNIRLANVDPTTGAVIDSEVIFDEEVLSNRVDAIDICIYNADDSIKADYSPLKSLTFKKNTGALATITSAAGTVDAPLGGYADIRLGIGAGNRILRIYCLTGEIDQPNR